MENNLFLNGSRWLRTDFHLHTKADSEFKYNDDPNYFVSKYIDRLYEENIKIGIITNHNKFDIEEFKALKKEAEKKEIYLLPGVEFSCKDGSKGIHALLVFDYNWINNIENQNYILEFLTAAFASISNPHTKPYPNSKYNLEETIAQLEQFHKDYFIIMAHVDDSNGLFKELSGRNLDSFIIGESFKRKVLGLQKSRSRDNRLRIEKLLLKNSPAYVEGTDNANSGIERIGCGNEIDGVTQKTYLKIGDFNFDSIKFALSDKKYRIASEIPELTNAYLKSISFYGGLLDNTSIDFSPELNNLIGIRGSGKSSIIEIMRYVLSIPLGSQAIDKTYKNGLIEYVLKSGGKVVLTVVNKHGKEYKIEKIYGQKEDVYSDGIRKDISIEAVFPRPIYFGQKDLSNKDMDFEADLIHKLIGNRLDSIRNRISIKINELQDIISDYKKLTNLKELKEDIIVRIKDAEHILMTFKEQGIEEKLNRQSCYDSDITKLSEIQKSIINFYSELSALRQNFNIFFNETKFVTDENRDIFDRAESIFSLLKNEFVKLTEVEVRINNYNAQYGKIVNELKQKKESLKEEFAKIKRDINIPNLNPDEFLVQNRLVEISKLKLKEIEKAETKRIELHNKLSSKISELNNLWHDEYSLLKKEERKINLVDNPLSIEIKYKGRRDKFLEKLKEVFRGSGITETNYRRIVDEYLDFIEIYKDKSKLKDILNENHYLEFNRRFDENFSELISYHVENCFMIKYKNKLLSYHSLGQRASALILFLLTQKENDILIIDQPEDDLDNQTIYHEVIKELKNLKGSMQFIFATHNANIPVLGDSEKVIVCTFSEKKINVQTGTIDTKETQENIVNIMEGGQEAFNLRKNIYDLWRIKQ